MALVRVRGAGGNECNELVVGPRRAGSFCASPFGIRGGPGPPATPPTAARIRAPRGVQVARLRGHVVIFQTARKPGILFVAQAGILIVADQLNGTTPIGPFSARCSTAVSALGERLFHPLQIGSLLGALRLASTQAPYDYTSSLLHDIMLSCMC